MATLEFGSSGARGPWGTAVTPDALLALGRALGHEHARVVVARDGRTSGPALEHAITAGLLASGARVSAAGVASTPALALAARGHDAGVMLTASHNPPEDGGVKLWTPEGQAFSGPRLERVLERVAAPPPHAPWRDLQGVEALPDAQARHVDAIVAHVGDSGLGLTVAVDGGNGPGGWEAATALRRLGCRVRTLNAQVDGRFPGRPSEPTPENLKDLRALVRASGCDLGVAMDGDGDRCVAITHAGDVVTGDQLLALLARERHGGEPVVAPVDASMALDDALHGAGVGVVRTPVGDAHVSAAMGDEGARFGGEASGSWIFRDVSLCPDGPLAAAVVAALAAERPLSERVAELPSYPLTRRAWRVPNASKGAFMDAVARRLDRHGALDTLDGARLHLGDAWVLVRPSGTEPKARLTCEARTPARLKAVEALATDAVERALKEVEP